MHRNDPCGLLNDYPEQERFLKCQTSEDCEWDYETKKVYFF